MTLNDLNISSIYSFNTKAAALLGTSIKNAKFIGKFDFNTAMLYENIVLKYRKILPLLPQGTPDNPESCIYYLFQSESGDKIIFADQWIDESTLEVVELITIQMVLPNASLQDIPRIRDLLNAAGYTGYTLKQI
jgi:hypothetical protein